MPPLALLGCGTRRLAAGPLGAVGVCGYCLSSASHGRLIRLGSGLRSFGTVAGTMALGSKVHNYDRVECDLKYSIRKSGNSSNTGM